jgi:glyoxylase-like metal-dependent hydrolase (beta-lactamase superfamily II)
MALSQSFTLGSLRCHLLEGGWQRLDGGAMFGVVPKPLWSRRVVPDERNRILLAMRCLLVEHPDGLVLIDTALGDKEDEKFLDIYGVENRGDPGPTWLEDALRAAGYRPEEVRWVINTHLHFDHAGGNTLRADKADKAGTAESAEDTSSLSAPSALSASQAVRLAFPNATYIVQKNELEFARHTNERTRASYLPPNFEPVAAAGRWQLLDGDGEILPGISARLTPGHVPWHQSIVLRSGGETAVYLADVMPTAAHLPLVYIMGYDLEPLRTLESKRALLREAAAGGWWFIFEHDPAVAMGRVVPDERGKGVELTEVRTVAASR